MSGSPCIEISFFSKDPYVIDFSSSSREKVNMIKLGSPGNNEVYVQGLLSRLLEICRFGNELWHSFVTVLSAVVVDFLLVGCGIATAGW